MAQGSLGGIPFYVDPESIAYHFDIKASATPTVGGKVVQVFGVRVSNIAVTGSIGIAGWEGQQEFLQQVTAQMQSQRGTSIGGTTFQEGAPIRFLFPPRGWDFQVYVIDYSEPGGSTSVILDPSIINPQWTLTLFIVNDNGGLKNVESAALDSYLQQLATGIGWSINIYNGPVVSPTYNEPSPAVTDAAKLAGSLVANLSKESG
jgi:hypothetical protein